MIGFWRAMERSTNEKSLAWLYFVFIRLDSLIAFNFRYYFEDQSQERPKGN